MLSTGQQAGEEEETLQGAAEERVAATRQTVSGDSASDLAALLSHEASVMSREGVPPQDLVMAPAVLGQLPPH